MEGKELPECKFGSDCYRKNKDHCLQYWHPPKRKESPAENIKPTMVDECGPSSGTVNCKSIVLILVGAPASGKSTFCQKVLEGARRPWTRICQDIIANGKRGTKAQCFKQASDALSEGQNVIIDRCNLVKEQRSEFLHLIGPQIEVHAVVLDLPAKLCIGRAVKRTAHEGGLQGDNAVNTYKDLGPIDDLSSGVYGQSSKDCKAQGNMLHFFKREKDPQTSNSASTEKLHTQKMTVTDFGNSDAQDSKEVIPCIKSLDSKTTESNAVQRPGCNFFGVSVDDCVPTLAFPSISTSDFHFDHEKAANII